MKGNILYFLRNHFKKCLLISLLLIANLDLFNSLRISIKTKKKLGPWGSTVVGNPFDDLLGNNVKVIRMRTGAWVDKIGTDGNPDHGGNGGGPSVYNVPAGRCITRVKVWYSTPYIRGLQYYPNIGSASILYGNAVGTLYDVDLGGCLRGIYGRSAQYVNQLGFYIGDGPVC